MTNQSNLRIRPKFWWNNSVSLSMIDLAEQCSEPGIAQRALSYDVFRFFIKSNRNLSIKKTLNFSYRKKQTNILFPNDSLVTQIILFAMKYIPFDGAHSIVLSRLSFRYGSDLIANHWGKKASFDFFLLQGKVNALHS